MIYSSGMCFQFFSVADEGFKLFHKSRYMYHTGQCKSTGGCYNELVVAILHTGAGVKGKK